MDYQVEMAYGMTECVQQAPLSMAYVPVQQWDCVYDNAMQALCRGTVFPGLDKPFLEGACPNV